MQAKRYGFYYNTTGSNIPAGSLVIKPKEKIHSTDVNFSKISQMYESYLLPEYNVPSAERLSYNIVGEERIPVTVEESVPIIEEPTPIVEKPKVIVEDAKTKTKSKKDSKAKTSADSTKVS